LKITLLIILSVFSLGFSKYPAIENSLSSKSDLAFQRARMVKEQLVGRGIKDKKVLDVMAKIPRQLFVEESLRNKAYGDYPLPIGEGQTISQPYVVALMTEALKLKPDDRVLEIGTGSGYQAAVLAEIVREVWTIEIRKRLVEKSEKLLNELGYKNI